MEATATPTYGAGLVLPELTIVVDYAYNADGTGDRSRLTALEGTHDHGAGPVTVTVLREVGPGGGWPEVEVKGTAPAMLAFLLKHYTAGQLSGPNGAFNMLGTTT